MTTTSWSPPSVAYSKPYRSDQALVDHLRSRGLTVTNDAEARSRLSLIGYDRLRIYFLSRRDPRLPGKPFQRGVSFDDIVSLYELDARLRQLCFEPCGTFEILLRNIAADLVSARYGSHPYDVLDVFRSPKDRIDCVKMFQRIYADSKDQRARHYMSRYSSPTLPPIWLMKEFLTFGNTMFFWRHLASGFRNQVSASFGVHDPEVFDSWIDCMVDLRNICAHHERLFNRAFQKQPKRLVRAGIPTTRSEPEKKKLRSLLECLDYLITGRGMSSTLVRDAGSLIGTCAAARPAESGF